MSELMPNVATPQAAPAGHVLYRRSHADMTADVGHGCTVLAAVTPGTASSAGTPTGVLSGRLARAGQRREVSRSRAARSVWRPLLTYQRAWRCS
jgi:hypothetical protein